MRTFRVAVVGCCHGELDIVYSTIKKKYNNQVDVVLFTGDFEAMRDKQDLDSMACPPKYRIMHDFHRYYHDKKKAPLLSIVIGGNHEASNYFQELKYGGWLAPNIYYLGNSGVINVGPGLRIAGISGIYDKRHYLMDHFEKFPYDRNSMSSVYHIRREDVTKLSLLRRSPLTIMMSHDWPTGVSKSGNEAQLLRVKPYLKKDIASGKLGSAPSAQLMSELRPAYWFSSHLHVRFTATVDHYKAEVENPDEIHLDLESDSEKDEEDENSKIKGHGHEKTHFLALDKPLPGRKFLELVLITSDQSNKRKRDENEHENKAHLPIFYDPEWLAIQRVFLDESNANLSSSDLDKLVTQELEWVEKNIVSTGKLQIPYNFKAKQNSMEQPVKNQQTVEYLNLIQSN